MSSASRRPKPTAERKTSELKPLLRTREVAQVLSISPRKAQMLAADGTLPAKRIGRSLRFRQSDVQRFIEQ